MGYDSILDYMFLSVDKEGEMVYDNLAEENPFQKKDFQFFVDVAKEKFGIDLSEFKETINNERVIAMGESKKKEKEKP